MPRCALQALCTAAVIALPQASTGAPPLTEVPPAVNVCWGYGCDRSKRLMLPAAAWRSVQAMFASPAPSATAERERIATAIARIETAVGTITGTHADRGGNIAGSGQPGQLDCIDESRNTAGYLHILAEHGLLRWHRVGARHKRLPWIFDQHWTATVVEHEDGSRWAIDAWFLDNGSRPHVQPLDAWLAKAELPPNPDAP
ncbi:MAG: hypothetical protein WD382_09595 [Halofilum sp. (in: g-proteobacteria)]